MFAEIPSAHAALAMTAPLVPDALLYAVLAAAVVLPALIIWLVMRSKARKQAGEAAAALEKLRTEAEAALQAAQARAAAEAAEHSRESTAAAASLADLQQRFSTHREVAERRANDASQQITRLEADLAATREIAAQLPPTQSRIKDLETALAAEQGRMKAQELAIEATNARAADFENRMIEAQNLLLKQKAEMQETAVELKKIRDEQAAYAAAGGAEAELAKAREATQQAESKISNLQRALKAAEARVEMVQKEFMNAVGVNTAPLPGAAAAASDKKLREMEEKVSQLEAESRKRAREDGYKIAELEYRLSEALEAARSASSATASAPSPAPSEAVPAASAVAVPPPSAAALAAEAVSEPVNAVTPEPLLEEAPLAGIPMTDVPLPGFSTLESPSPATAREDI